MRFLMRLLLQLGAVALVALAGGQALAVTGDTWWLTAVAGLATAVLAVVVYRGVVGRTERRTVTELAPAGAAGATGRGLLIGVLWCATVIANIWFLGGYHVESTGSAGAAVGLLGFMAAAATTEELLVRGVLFRLAEERLGTWPALVLTGALFGAMHLTNPDATPWGVVAIAVEAGGLLAAAYAATRTLWLPIGLHLGWNFALSGIFGAEVSGNDTAQGLLQGTTSGSTIVTGGDFGPEGSAYTVAIGIVLTGVFMWLAHRRGHVVPTRFRYGHSGSGAGVRKDSLT